MANNATTYLEHKLLDFLFKNNSESFASPGNSIYVGLATAASDAEGGTVTEATFTNYARQQVNAAGWTVTALSADTQTAKNTANIDWPASGGTTNIITHAFIADALTSGNILFVGALDANKTIETDDVFRINLQNLTVELK